MDRAGLLDLVMQSNRYDVDLTFTNHGQISVTVWSSRGVISDVWNSWNYDTEHEFFETVKKGLK